MKSIELSIYVAIVLHFLRSTARKLVPAAPAKPTEPYQVGTVISRRAGGGICCRYVRLVTCHDQYTANALAAWCNSIAVNYHFSVRPAEPRPSRAEIVELEMCRMRVITDNIKDIPDQAFFRKLLAEAWVAVHTKHTI